MRSRLRVAKACQATLILGWLTASVGVGQQPSAPGSQLGAVELFGDEESFTIQAATKTEIPISKAPGSVTVISAQQIRESGAQTIPEILRLVSGVNVRWNPMVQTIDIRGFGQNPFTSRVLLLIDGVPYNSWNKGGFPQHPGLDFFMLQNIKRLEILRGPGSSLYGENAYWGVINIVTLSGEDLEGGKLEVAGGDLMYQNLGVIYGRKVGEDGSFLVSGRSQRGQLPTGFWFDEADSEVVGSDIFLKGKVKGLEVSYYRHEDEMDGFSMPGFIPGTVFRSAPKISQTVDILALKANHTTAKGFTLSGDVSYAQRNGSRCGSCHAAPENPAFEGTVDHGFQLIGDFRLGFKMAKSHNVLLGVEARRVDTGDHTDQLLTPQETTADVVFAYTKIAGYVQDQISLADDRVNLVLGARFDGGNDLFDSELSPRLAMVYTPDDRLAVRAGWSTAFRFPNFNELYQDSFFLSLDRGAFAIPLQVFEPNPELRPEEIRTFDLGLEYRVSRSLSTKVDFFYSEVKSFIVLAFRPQAMGGTRLRNENHPDIAEIYGGELELRWRPTRRFNSSLNWSYQDQRQRGDLTDSSGKPFEFVYAPENKLNLAAYLGPYAGFRAALEVEWRDERFGPSFWNAIVSREAGLGTLDQDTLVNVRLSYEPPVGWGRTDRGLKISLHGKNLLNEEIVETLLPINMLLPESTYYGALEIRF